MTDQPTYKVGDSIFYVPVKPPFRALPVVVLSYKANARTGVMEYTVKPTMPKYKNAVWRIPEGNISARLRREAHSPWTAADFDLEDIA